MSKNPLETLRQWLIWAVYLLLGVCLVYSLFYLASSLGLSFFVLVNRGMAEQVVSGSLLSVPWDVAVWCVALFVVLGWLIFNVVSGALSRVYRLATSVVLVGLIGWVCLVLVGLLSVTSLVLVSSFVFILCFVACLSIFSVSGLQFLLHLLLGALLVGLLIEVGTFVWFSVPVALNFGSSALGLHWSFVELSFANLAYPFLPYAYLLLVLLGVAAFVIKVAPARWVSKISRSRFSAFFAPLKGSFELGNDDGFGFLRGRFVLVLAILVGVAVSCLFVVFTVLPWTNPTNMLVSVDSPVYFKWITYMHSVDVNGALSFALANDRATFLILAYALSFVASPLIVIQFVAALLIVLFGVVSLLVMRLFCSVRTVWVFAVLLVPFSFQALGLIYSGYFANMLALILIFAFVILFFRVLYSWSSLDFFAMIGVSVLILLSHSWTWFIFAISLLAFLFLEWRLAVRDKSLWPRFKGKCILIGASVGVGLLVDLVRTNLSPVSSSTSVLSTATSSLSFPNGAFLLSGIQKTVDLVLGGVFANGVLVGLSIVGFLVLVRFRSEVSNFFVSWIFVACLAILFAAQDFVFDRFLFFIPWVVLSSLGLFCVLRFVSCRFVGRWRWLVFVVVLAFVFLLLLNNGLHYLFNIDIW